MIVSFPDGTRVRGTGLLDRRGDGPEPSFGLYLDARWSPAWPFELIDWPDFGLPADAQRAADQISAAYARAARGDDVEVGCLGGLGRTGTVLACMAVLSGVPTPDAVGWVRAHYDQRAVETHEQEDWVLWFEARSGGLDRSAGQPPGQPAAEEQVGGDAAEPDDQ